MKTPSEALDFVFSFFEFGRTLQRDCQDSQVRHPELVIDLARRRGIVPARHQIALVTGSKGKGSAARLLAWGLQESGYKTGLLVSPEEIHHFDRIRINNCPIAEERFAEIVSDFSAELLRLQATAPDRYYIPPTAIFSLVALQWWKESAVDFCIIEGGRGARFDEIGQFDAQVGIVTTVLPEHLDKLGPTEESVAVDKLFLVDKCQYLVCGPIAARWADVLLNSEQRSRILPKTTPPALEGGEENWAIQSERLAGIAASKLTRWPISIRSWRLPSFERTTMLRLPDGSDCKCLVLLNGAVVPECLQAMELAPLAIAGSAVVYGLSDTKDAEGIVRRMQSFPGIRHFVVPLESRVNHISSEWVFGCDFLFKLPSLDVVNGADESLRKEVFNLLRSSSAVLFVGVQTFLRSVRTMLDIPLSGPGPPRQ